MNRKGFLQKMGIGAAGSVFAGRHSSLFNKKASSSNLFFKVSLAEWSFHKSLFGGKMKNLDFPVIAREKFGIDAVEYVDQFFKDKAKDKTYLKALNKRANDHGVSNVQIMIDNEGQLGSTNTKKRKQAVENHLKWVDAAAFLGCFAIRVNIYGKGSPQDISKAAVESLSRLTEYAEPRGLDIMVENHGGYSSNGQWVANVMKQVNNPHCGTLPDPGNFSTKQKSYNRYKGVREMMPFAKDVSAKTYDFDSQGNETTIDYHRFLKILKDADYKGYLGVEFETKGMPESEGVKKTLKLLNRIGSELS
ncbi:MAG TPA: sugar phosphate isomerase/epimerase family protein [Balneolaceae bacterium]|nr:sugar phosphate isomerase/epimerase family protein [Balneolaceae bacterium]